MCRKRLLSICLILTLVITSVFAGAVFAKSKLNKTKITIKVGQTYKLKIKKKGKKKVKWVSKNKKIATVSKKGKVKGKKPGKTKIIAKRGKKKFTCKVTVISNVAPTPQPTTKTPTPETTTATPETTTAAPETTTAAPVTDFTYNISGNNVVITGYKGTKTAVVIPKQIEGKNVSMIADRAFQESAESIHITSVTLPETLITIGSLSFANCQSLQTVTIQGTELKTIKNQAFDQCISLREIALPDGLTTIGEYAFAGCSSLTTITIPSTVLSFGTSPFSGCSSLEEGILSDGLTVMPNMSYNSGIKRITIPSSITSLDNYGLSGCNNLEEVVIDANITTLPEGFLYNNPRLSSVTLPSTLQTIESYALADNEDLVYIYIPESVISIADDAFDGDTFFTTILGVKGSYAETFALSHGYIFFSR